MIAPAESGFMSCENPPWMLAEPIPERPATSWTAPAVIRACELDDGDIINEGGTAEVSDFRPLLDGGLFYFTGNRTVHHRISMIDKV